MAFSPSLTTPEPDMLLSSLCESTVSPNVLAYLSALSMTAPLLTGSPSSETAIAPAALILPNSQSSAPFCPRVIQPIGRTSALLHSAERSFTYRIICGLSSGGTVLGIQQTVVNPPATAAREPVHMSSLWV